jgi:hypothetical protein
MRKMLTPLIFTAAVLGTQAASAVTYIHEATNPRGSAGAGDLTSISLAYTNNATTDELSGSFSLQEHSGLADTAWLVLSDGKNPKGNEQDHGILYMDFASGNSWLYQYNGQNNLSSYTSGDLLAFYENSVSANNNGSSVDVDFSVSFAGVTAPTDTWTGMSFDESVGVWFHGLEGSLSGDETGITSYTADAGGQFWYDTSYSSATRVPEMDGAGAPLAAAFMLSLLAFARDRFTAKKS